MGLELRVCFFHILYCFFLYIIFSLLFFMLPLLFLFYRPGFIALRERLVLFSGVESNGRVVWFHAVSAGEVAAAAAVFREMVQLQTGLHAVVTSNTSAGRRIARRDFPREVVVLRPPLDTPTAVRRFIHKTEAVQLVVMEIELWPNLIAVSSWLGLNPLLCNGRMPVFDLRAYRRLRFYFQYILSCFTLIGVQDRTESGRYSELGASQKTVKVLGNVKYDLVPAGDALLPFAVSGSVPVVVVGSSHVEEEALYIRLFAAVLRGYPEAVCVIAPRDIARRGALLKKARASGIAALLRSQLDGRELCGQLLVLDTVGELRAVYSIASVAVIGGSFSSRIQGHDPLEAAVQAAPVVFGPWMGNFAGPAEDLLRGGGGVAVNEYEELVNVVCGFLCDAASSTEVGDAALRVVRRGVGAAPGYAKLLSGLIQEK